ncbi:hypothetical protein BH09SUM1_BH09SUM1_04350 [soil metagenome]
MQFTGFLQGDQPSYTAFVRATYLRGNGIVFASPFDSDARAPRVLINLTYSALGVLNRLTGDRPVIAWEIWRAVFGIGTYGLFALIAVQLLTGRARVAAVAFGMFGGGIGWIYALGFYFSGRQPSWFMALNDAEYSYGWWCLNLFRQAIYPLELFYHTLVFAAIYAYLRRGLAVATMVVALSWWCHMITAALLTSIIGGAMLLEWRLKKEERRELSVHIAVIGVTSLVAVWYNAIFLHQFPAINSWIKATLSLESPMYLADYPRAYGPLLIAPLLMFWTPMRRWILDKREGRLLAVWIAAVLCWSHQDAFGAQGVQPIHFVRGHLYAALVLLAGKALELALVNCPAPRRWLAAGAFLFLVAAADNAFFVARVALSPPEPGILSFDADSMQVINYYRDRHEPTIIQCQDRGVGVMILARTSHSVFSSEPFLTPFYNDKMHLLPYLNRAGRIPAFKSIGVQELIIHRNLMPGLLPWHSDPALVDTLLANDTYVVIRLR